MKKRQIKNRYLPSSSSESSSSEPDPDSSSESSPRISALIDLYLSSFSRYLGSNLKISNIREKGQIYDSPTTKKKNLKTYLNYPEHPILHPTEFDA
jgi:hypothetical protein